MFNTINFILFVFSRKHCPWKEATAENQSQGVFFFLFSFRGFYFIFIGQSAVNCVFVIKKLCFAAYLGRSIYDRFTQNDG